MIYEVKNGRMVRTDTDGQPEVMCNFVAEITKETRYVDGITTRTKLEIKCKVLTGDPQKPEQEIDPIEVDSEEFASMGWILGKIGVRAIVIPGSGIKDDLRTAIQMLSKPEQKTVYRHLGWTEVEGRRMFLHAGGGIGKNGNDKTITVELPPELSKYKIEEQNAQESLKAVLNLVTMLKPEIGWPLLGAAIAPILGEQDFALHLAGRTGTFKSEIMSLFQSLYGSGMDARHLPGSWSSTANALEAQAFLAKNCAFVIDDFVPTGTAWQQKAYQVAADKLMRAQGNQSGRARLTDVSSLQTTMYPRGVIMSTGEDVPEGHSVRARMLILEMSPGDVDTKKLTMIQKERKLLSGAIGVMCKMLAAANPNLDEAIEELRAEFVTIGHTRTPTMLAKIVTAVNFFLNVCITEKVLGEKDAVKKKKEAKNAIVYQGNQQIRFLEDTDPVEMFFKALRETLGAGQGHLRTKNGGTPLNSEIVGWTKEQSTGEMAMYKSRGPTIGWVNWIDDILWIDMTVGYKVIMKTGGKEITLSQQTLLKRMKELGKLVRVDEQRQRNTIRVTAQEHPRTVIAVSASDAMQLTESPNEEQEEEGDE